MDASLTRKLWPLYVAFGVVALLLAFLFVRTGEKQASSSEARYRLKWLANPGFIGDLYADTYGYFAERGLNVQVKPGGPEHDAIAELEKGEAEFGVASADQVIQAVEKGAEVKVVAQIYQKNPVRWIYRYKGKEIKTAGDLVGMKVGVAIGDNDDTIMRALLKLAGIDESTVILVPVKYDYTPFLKGEVDLFPVYINTQAVELRMQLEANQEEVRLFDPEGSGIRFVANSIVTTPRLIKEKPDVVRSFVFAALRGWQDALREENSGMSLRAILRFTKDATPDTPRLRKSLAMQIAETRPLVFPVGSRKIGDFDIEAWNQTESILLERMLIKKPVHVENHLSAEFLPSSN